MSDERAVPESKGVTIELLSVVDLGPEIEGLAGRQLRMRRVTLAPGAVFGPPLFALIASAVSYRVAFFAVAACVFAAAVWQIAAARRTTAPSSPQ